MSTVWMWFRTEWRGRWRALLGLALLMAFACASVSATVAGARRGASAYDRLLAVTEPGTVLVLLNQGAFDWEAVRSMPDVASVSAFAVTGYGVDGLGDHPENGSTALGGFPFVDDQILDTLERPVVLEGRLADPARDDEVMVSPKFASHFGKRVGDRLTLHLYSAEQLDTYDEGDPAGPEIEATIVGVIRSGWFSDTADNSTGSVQPSLGLYRDHPDNIVGTAGVVNINALVRLRDGAAGLDRFERDFSQRFGIENAEFESGVDSAQHIHDVTTFEARAMMVLALTALVASAILLGIAISRYCSGSFADLDVMRSFGAGPAQLRAAIALAPTSAAAGGAALAVAASYWASGWFPVGSAALYEPAPGRSFDALVLLPLLLIVPALVAVAAILSLRTARRREDVPATVSAIESATSTWPLTLGLGTRFAVAGRSTRNASSGRPALIGVALVITGVIGALTFAHGIADATDGYRRFGQTFELATFLGAGGTDFVDATSTLSTIADDPDVDGVIDALSESARTDTGSVSLFTYSPVGRPVDVIVTDGRLPTTASEIALAPLSARQEHVGVGDTMAVSGPLGSRTLTVTGIAFVPVGPHNGYASGGWVLPATFHDLFDGFRFRFALASTRPGVDPQAVIDRLGSQGIEMGAAPIVPVTERAELAELRTVPLLLAGFLALLGVGAVAHALASTARRRRHDIAMLRTLGMRPRDSGAIIFVQAGVIALVGLVVGVPVGLLVGHTVWRSVAADTPIAFVAPERWPLVAFTTLGVVGLAALLAVWPSRRLATLHLGRELRSE